MGTYKSATPRLEVSLRKHGVVLTEKGVLCWSPETPSHPRNWPSRTKFYNCAFIMVFEALVAAMSTAGTASAESACSEYSISTKTAYFVFTTIGILGEALAGLVAPPLSEAFGRKGQFLMGAVMCTVGAGLTVLPSFLAVVVGRLVSGFAGGIPPSISAGALEDMFDDPDEMTWAIFGWASTSNIGLVVGPIISAQLTQRLGWRYTFYFGIIASFIVSCGALGYNESRPSCLLDRKLDLVRGETGMQDIRVDSLDHISSWQDFLKDSMTRPARLFFTEPIVFLCAMLNAIAFALIYGMTESLVIIYTGMGFSPAAANLAFIPVLLGVILSVVFRLRGVCTGKQPSAAGEETPLQPESRLRSFRLTAPLLAIGLWFCAWTVPPVVHLHWSVSMIGLVPIGLAANDFDTVLADYIVTTYGSYSASACAAISWTTALLSAIFTSLTPVLYEKLGNNYATTVFAVAASFFCISPFVLLRYGERLRMKSPFAVRCSEMKLTGMSLSTESLAEDAISIKAETELDKKRETRVITTELSCEEEIGNWFYI